MVMENKGLSIVSFLACDLHIPTLGLEGPMMKKIIISLTSLSLVFILFLYPFSTLLDDYISAAPLIGQEKEIILSEPSMMLLIGSVLLGMGIFVRRKFKKSL